MKIREVEETASYLLEEIVAGITRAKRDSQGQKFQSNKIQKVMESYDQLYPKGAQNIKEEIYIGFLRYVSL